MNNILYCIIRSERILYEALCSIRSLAMIYGKQFDLLTVTVVTDLPLYMFDSVSCFPNVRIDVISEETSHDWLFQCKANMFRVKILALMYYLDKYKSDVLFVDSDTVFVDRPEYIFDYMAHGQFVMNFKCMSLKEVVDRFYGIESDLIKNEDSRKRVIFYRKLYERRRIDSLFSSKTYEIPETFVPYNSGLIGLKYSDRSLLNDVLDLCDTIYFSEKYVCSEEFAFSLVFRLAGRDIVQCNKGVYHYFYDKRTRLLISCFLDLYGPGETLMYLLSELRIEKKVFDVLSFKDIPYNMTNYVSELPKCEEQSYLTGFNSFKFDLLNVRKLCKKLILLM